MFLVREAFADVATTAAATPSAGEQLMNTLLMFGPILVIFYFLLIRPQQKKIKQHHALVAALRRGDKIVTAGGVLGKINKVNTEKGTLTVQIAEGVEVEVLTATVTSVLDSTKPTNDNKK